MTNIAFFEYARERHAIYLRRQMGLPRNDLTDNTILQTYRFCNVFRELDTTTIWLRENVRDPLRDKPEVLLAVVLFRWFNRITTGEAIFEQTIINGMGNFTAWELLLDNSDTDWLRQAILAYCGKGPYVTGSYIIKTPDGSDKLTGVLWCVKRFMEARVTVPGIVGALDWQEFAKIMLDGEACVSLEMCWNWLRRHSYLGDFMAYEIVSDLRYTSLLCHSPDIMTWANPGPGAMRGLNRIHGRELDKKIPKEKFIEEMRHLLGLSLTEEYWPRWNGQAFCGEMPADTDPWDADAWPLWDMRTVEHTLCEFDKYERVRLGQGAPRQKFK